MSIPLTTRIPIRDRNGNVVDEKEVATYAGLLARAHDEGLKRVETDLVQAPHPENNLTAIVRAVVETDKGVFAGIGDASPDNVNRRIVPHLIRMAETRAKARALRDAVNIGVVAMEELGDDLVQDLRQPERSDNVRPFRQSSPSRSRERGPSSDTITEAQRRLLFRLLAQAGYEGDAARQVLCEEAGVEDVRAIGKRHASRLIDAWKQEVASA